MDDQLSCLAWHSQYGTGMRTPRPRLPCGCEPQGFRGSSGQQQASSQTIWGGSTGRMKQQAVMHQSVQLHGISSCCRPHQCRSSLTSLHATTGPCRTMLCWFHDALQELGGQQGGVLDIANDWCRLHDKRSTLTFVDIHPSLLGDRLLPYRQGHICGQPPHVTQIPVVGQLLLPSIPP